MRNYCLTHSMPGIDKNLFVCSCGHQSYHQRLYPNGEAIECPECKNSTPVYLESFNELSFSEVEFERQFLYWEKTSDDLYKFNLNIFLIRNAYKMNYSTKKIKLLNEKYKHFLECHYVISFNGHAYNEPIIKITNIKKPQEEYSLDSLRKEIIQIYQTSCNRKIRKHYKNIDNSSWLKNKFYSESEDFSYSLRSVFRDLEELENYCKIYEQLIKIGIDPYYLNGKIKQDGSTPVEILQLTPQSVKILKEIGSKYHNALQVIEKEFQGQAINYINTFAKLDDYDTHNATRLAKLVNEANLSIPKLYKYLHKEAPMQQGLYNPSETLTLLYDSFNLAKDLELPFDKNPKALKRYHDTLVKEHKVIADAKKNEMFAIAMEEYKHLEYTPDAKVIMPKEGSEEEPKIIPPEFLIRLPKDAQDLIREGKVMRHCVASYVDRIIRRETLVFFLRRSSAPDEPFCTIEVSPITLNIRQVKGKGNRKITELNATKTIEKWCKKRNIKWDKYVW